MKKVLFILLAFSLAVSCKKANLTQLEVVDDSNTQTSTSGTTYLFHSKTVLYTSSSSLYPINDLIVTNGTLYLVGKWYSFSGIVSPCMITYNGSAFSAVTGASSILSSSNIKSVCYTDGKLFIGGSFYPSSSSSTLRYLGYLQGSSLVTYSTYSGPVNTIEPTSNGCYVAGTFTSVNGTSCVATQYINQSGMYFFGSGISTTYPSIYSFKSFGSVEFLGGSLTGSSDKNMIRGNGSTWSIAGNGFNSTVKDMEIFGGKLYAGGYMTTDGFNTNQLNYVNYIPNYYSNWQKAGSNNLPGYCYSLTTHNNKLLAASNFNGTGYVYSLADPGSAWTDCLSPSINLKTLEKIQSYNGKLYGIERDASTGIYSFVRFD